MLFDRRRSPLGFRLLELHIAIVVDRTGQRPAGGDDCLSDVRAIRRGAVADFHAIELLARKAASQLIPHNHFHFFLGHPAPTRLHFGDVDADEADPCASDDDGFAVDHPGGSADESLRGLNSLGDGRKPFGIASDPEHRAEDGGDGGEAVYSCAHVPAPLQLSVLLPATSSMWARHSASGWRLNSRLMSRASLALSVLIAALSAALGKAGRAAAAADQSVVLARGEQPLLVVLAAPQDAINATTVLQLAVYTLIPVLPVALATMPLAELSARLLKLVF